MLINKLAIIGVGLIGGSLAQALRLAGACKLVSGYGRNTENLDKAIALGVIDEYFTDISKVILDADVIVIATPLTTYSELLKEISLYIKPGAIVTDVGSAKKCVVDDAKRVLGSNIHQFIPGHPIAGKEKSGVTASSPDLFQDHMVILTPLPENLPDDVQMISSMWETCGANVVSMSVEHHDLMLAATSHLPHVLAYSLVSCLAKMSEEENIFKYSGGGFRDFSRIASSNPEMWSDICISNQENLLEVIEQYKVQLNEITELIKNNDKKSLEYLFSKVKITRDRFVEQKSSDLNDKRNK
ncbi:MAG: prephenate dehydrogenase [Gammaproteobacteria bacterium]|jgi:prephenate dehydrogenase